MILKVCTKDYIHKLSVDFVSVNDMNTKLTNISPDLEEIVTSVGEVRVVRVRAEASCV